MQQIIIGREGNQPFPINDEYVSRQHAVFSYDEITGIMTIIDKSRPEIGTFIRMGNQFQQISQCNVDVTTDIRLGPFFTFRVGQLFQPRQIKPQKPVQSQPPKPVQRQPPKPEKVDIAYLRRVAENYESKKVKLEQKQANINNFRSLSLVGSAAAGLISPLITNMVGGEWYLSLIGPIVAVLFLVTLIIYCNKASKDVITSKNKNEKSYKITFCCPKCHLPFSGKLYENILAEGKCPKCKVDFYDSSI